MSSRESTAAVDPLAALPLSRSERRGQVTQYSVEKSRALRYKWCAQRSEQKISVQCSILYTKIRFKQNKLKASHKHAHTTQAERKWTQTIKTRASQRGIAEGRSVQQAEKAETLDTMRAAAR